MYRISYLVLFFCAITANLQAQPDRNALLQEYHQLDTSINADHPKLVIDQSKRMLEIARQLQVDSMILKANILQGQALHFLGVFDGALKLYYSSLSMAEQNHDCYYQIKFCILIGRLYQSMNDPKNSQEFMQKAKEYAITCRQFKDTLSINYEIGFNMVMMDQKDAGIQLVEKNLQVARQSNDQDDMLYGVDNLSNVLAESGNPQKALQLELELVPMMDTWEDPYEKLGVYEHLSEIYVKLHDWDNAQKYLQMALPIATKLQTNDWIFECYKLQSMIDAGRGNYKNALLNHQRYLELKDSVYQNQYDEKMAGMNALYDLESKQKTIALLEKDQKIKDGQIEEQRILLLVAALLLIILFLGNRFLHQRKTNQLREIFAQDLLKAQENERQMISRELHDSVGQNILFVKNRLQRLVPSPDESLVKSVDDALEEVRTIAKGLYPNQLEQYGLSSAIVALCELTQESSGIFASCDLEGIDEKLDREAKINCYRIIQECINNTLKHAEATAIRITSVLHPGKVELVVQDNGKGFDKSQLERKAVRSFGLVNMAERIKMLRGKFDLETSANKGAKLTFTIPV